MKKIRAFCIDESNVTNWQFYRDEQKRTTILHITVNFKRTNYLIELTDEDFIKIMIRLFVKYPKMLKAINEDVEELK